MFLAPHCGSTSLRPACRSTSRSRLIGQTRQATRLGSPRHYYSSVLLTRSGLTTVGPARRSPSMVVRARSPRPIITSTFLTLPPFTHNRFLGPTCVLSTNTIAPPSFTTRQWPPIAESMSTPRILDASCALVMYLPSICLHSTISRSWRCRISLTLVWPIARSRAPI